MNGITVKAGHQRTEVAEMQQACFEQQMLWGSKASAEDPAFLSNQLLTYLGNKRSLLEPIGEAVQKVKRRLGKDHLRTLDAFSGSGVVSRYLKQHSTSVTSVDIESYAGVVARCYLANRSRVALRELANVVEGLNRTVSSKTQAEGFISELYAPRDEKNITPGDRVFYTRENARRLDDYRRLIEDVPLGLHDLLLGPLLSKASIHANTAGVFKGFYKDSRTGIGRFGGSGADALSRIRGEIQLETPVLSRFECETKFVQGDINLLADTISGFDLAYLDPPYNQHPYGSNYFMLNLIVEYERPERISNVSGIPADWRRSTYNVRREAPEAFRQLVERLDSKFLLVSYNNEGFISPEQMHDILTGVGRVSTSEIPYTVFRGCRNIRGRSSKVIEQLFVVEKH